MRYQHTAHVESFIKAMQQLGAMDRADLQQQAQAKTSAVTTNTGGGGMSDLPHLKTHRNVMSARPPRSPYSQLGLAGAPQQALQAI